MLQKIRDNFQGTLAKIVIALIAIPFALFGIEAFFTGGEPRVAVVDGVEITRSELEQGIELQRRRLLAQSEDKVDPAMLDEARLREPVLDSLIERRLIGAVAERAGFRVGEALLDRIILEDDSFHENGSFSQQRFQGILASNGMSPMSYRTLLREEMQINQVLGGLAASEFSTQAELEGLARITQQSVDVRYLTVPLDASSSPEVPEERIQSYYDANLDEFRTEEQVSVEYIELDIDDLYEAVPEAEVRREYDSRMADYKAAEERQAAHVMISSLDDEKAKARLSELRARALAGEDFGALARENSEDVGSAASGGDLGYSAGDAFPPEFEEALRSLAEGGISEPFRTDSGWHIVKLLDVREQAAPAFEDLRAEIERALQERAARPRYVERLDELANMTYNSEGLADAAGQFGLELRSSPSFSRRGGEGVFADSRVISAAFSKDVLEEKQNSEMIELDAGRAIVLRVREHEPERQLELPEVRERIRELLVEAIRREQTEARARVLLAAIEGGAGIEETARAQGLAWQLAPGHRRGARDLPEELSEAVFRHPRPGAMPTRGQVTLPAGDVAVFELTSFRQGEVSDLPPEQQQTMRGLLAQSRGAAVASHYRQRLRETAEVEIIAPDPV